MMRIVFAILCSMVATFCVAAPLESPKRLTGPALNADGLQIHWVILDESLVAAEDTAGEPAAASTREPISRDDPFRWHKPNARAFVKRLERDFGVKAISMTSY